MGKHKALGIGLIILAAVAAVAGIWQSRYQNRPASKEVEAVKEQLPAIFISQEAKSEDFSNPDAAKKITLLPGETLKQGIRYTVAQPREAAYQFAVNQSFGNGWSPVSDSRENDNDTVIRMYNREKIEYLYIVLMPKSEKSTEVNLLPVLFDDPIFKRLEGNKK